LKEGDLIETYEEREIPRTPRLHFQADPAITSGEAVEEIIRRLQDRD
jgi:ribosome-binding factor A